MFGWSVGKADIAPLAGVFRFSLDTYCRFPPNSGKMEAPSTPAGDGA